MALTKKQIKNKKITKYQKELVDILRAQLNRPFEAGSMLGSDNDTEWIPEPTVNIPPPLGADDDTNWLTASSNEMGLLIDLLASINKNELEVGEIPYDAINNIAHLRVDLQVYKKQLTILEKYLTRTSNATQKNKK